ncbi:MAG: hypothetical protein A3J93_04395 [Candidatus Magasanikbacteria bacterium RIFOXYC2_FULL_42_28]|uniref:DUF3147 domain-containing protein n=1 Tax=Candidatus Magasanikbacteria bacterium RIFOXYC2_FULL_42_28 TaxID=1798704 RepID=A0A1F6NX28_9BACT|nr:MAG: hypothetical protein A3J93_04395 [Candidatus Magasanikbacteria bacterium RIFOXYC2_FULL_42_28]
MEIILKSLISAVITGLILVVSNYASPKLAGALGGIPIVFAVSYVLITMQNKSVAKDFLAGGVYGAIAAIFFSIILILFNYLFPKYHWVNFIIAYALCFLAAFGMSYFTTKNV